MKLSNILSAAALMVASVHAFTVVQPNTRTVSLTQQHMFGGSGVGPTEDDPAAMKQMEQAANSMGMSVEEYQLGMKARIKLGEELGALRIKTGDESSVAVERDGNNPAQHINIIITEKGKALGKDTVSAELCAALKQASDKSRLARADAQKNMMQFIGEEMKRLGKD